MTPEELFYNGDYDRIDQFTDAEGNVYFDHDARIALMDAFADVLSAATEVKFNPEIDVTAYARTTAKPGRVRQDDVWQPTQSESASEARKILHDLGCPAQPFSAGASEALMKRGTDHDVPNDLSSLAGMPDDNDGTATV